MFLVLIALKKVVAEIFRVVDNTQIVEVHHREGYRHKRQFDRRDINLKKEY